MAPTPKVKRGSGVNQIPYGKVGEINDAYAEANAMLDQLDQGVGEDEYEPAVEDQEEDELLFRASDRPAEPVTDGLPFGPGRNFRTNPTNAPSPEEAFARSILEDPRSSAEEKSFANRVLNGE